MLAKTIAVIPKNGSKFIKKLLEKCDKTKTTLVFYNVGQLVVEYEILKSFGKLVQNSILNDSLANIIKHLCGFSIVSDRFISRGLETFNC